MPPPASSHAPLDGCHCHGRVGRRSAPGRDSVSGEAVVNGAPLLCGDARDGLSSFVVGILGNLHIDPPRMEDCEEGRERRKEALDQAREMAGDEHAVLV